MLVPVISDSHFGARNDLKVFQDYQENYYKNEFFPYIDEHNVTNIIHLGDVFDRRKYINFATLDRVRRFFFDELAKRGIMLHVILGNHDVAYKNTNRVNSLDLLLRDYDNINIYHDPIVLTLDGQRIGLVPWINEENYEKSIDFIKNNSDVDWLGGHFAINGAEMIHGIKCQDGLTPSMFADYKLVISGHFHTASKISNIWYPGNQYDITWSDYGQVKKFLSYDTDTDLFDEVLTKSRMFYKLYYDDTDEFELKKLQSTFAMFEGKYVKVIVKEKISKVKFDSFIADLYNHNPHEVRIIEADVAIGLSDEEINIETKTTMEIIDSTIENMSLLVEKDDLKQLFHELYKEALDIEV